ncbi:MAG: HNH endonuclease, partial [Anaerolineae bacterium]|nr:HNH endonuclease [Anaerolineae bacterium]
SCNRSKSWVCEHCENWRNKKDSRICSGCFWTNPTNYQHIAMKDIRRLEIVWTENETHHYQWLKNQADKIEQSLAEYIKNMIIGLQNQDS